MGDADRPLASFPAAAREKGLGKTALYAWWAAGDLPPHVWVKLNGRLYIRRRAFAEWLNGAHTPNSSSAE